VLDNINTSKLGVTGMPKRQDQQDLFDHDADGIVGDHDLQVSKQLQQIEEFGKKAHTRKWMAISALCAMYLFTFALFTDIVKTTRVEALADVSGMFYLTMAGIVAAYFGTTAWLTKQ
jgi:hypothetical protein